MRQVVILVLVVVLTGCAHQFAPLRGQSDEQRAQDTATCKEASQVPAAQSWFCVGAGPALVSSAMMLGCFSAWAVVHYGVRSTTDPAQMWACMEARGYEGAKPSQ